MRTSVILEIALIAAASCVVERNASEGGFATGDAITGAATTSAQTAGGADGVGGGYPNYTDATTSWGGEAGGWVATDATSGWSGTNPVFFLPSGSAVVADPPPPPIQGGTLLVAKDGKTAIAADPDRDQIHVVDLDAAKLTFSVALQPGDQPGRAVEDADGFVHVALRGGGAIVRIDPKTGKADLRRTVCPAPSGIAFDATLGVLYVACETGELVTIAPTAATPSATIDLGRDLRDVGVRDGAVWVSRFRSSEVIVLSAAKPAGKLAPKSLPLPVCDGVQVVGTDVHTPTAAWRMRTEGATPLILHQLAGVSKLTPKPGGYNHAGNGSCARAVEVALTAFAADGTATLATNLIGGEATVVTDFALEPNGKRVAIAATGGSWSKLLTNVAILGKTGDLWQSEAAVKIAGEVTAVAFDGKARLIVQSREPAFVAIRDASLNVVLIPLSALSRFDTGLALFHLNCGIGLGCASCHPAGREDGHVWNFADVGPRRTQSLAQHLAATAPYHWDGLLADVPALVHTVFTQRMSGAELDAAQTSALQHWLFSRQPPAAKLVADPAAVARGKKAFMGVASCSGCHAGENFTNNQAEDVGKGPPTQVPTLLGVGARAPFLHDGCAATLADRFAPACGGKTHGNLDAIAASDVADLVAYLESL